MLVRFDIGAFRGMSLSEEALEYADEILKCFHSRGKEIILRVLYDTQGKGMEREPTLFSIVLTHMRQLGAVVHMRAISLSRRGYLSVTGEKCMDQSF